MVICRCSMLVILLATGTLLSAVELVVEAPDPLLPGRQLPGNLVIIDPRQRAVDLDLPEVDGLQIRLNPGSQRFQSGGGTSRMTYELLFTARDPGTYDIPAATLTFEDGSTVRSQALTVEAWGPQAWLDGRAAVKASFEPERVVPGEEVVLRWQVASPVDIGLVAAPDSAPTLPAGLVPSGEARREAVGWAQDRDGAAWQVITHSLPVIAVRPGEHRLEGSLTVGRRQRSLIDDRFQAVAEVPIRPATLTVADFPSAGRPEDFSGLVGRIDIEAELDRREISLGEGTRLLLTIRGSQVDLIDRPRLSEPPGLRLRPVELEDDDRAPATDIRRFAWNLQPERSGRFAIPALELSWFDPEQQRYRRSLGPELELEVLPGRRRGLEIAGHRLDARSDGETAAAPRAALQPLRGEAGARSRLAAGWWALAAGAAIGLVLAGGWRLRERRPRRDPITDLRRAVRHGDLGDVDQALNVLRRDTPDDLRAELDALIAEVQRARYGDGDFSTALRERLLTWRNSP